MRRLPMVLLSGALLAAGGMVWFLRHRPPVQAPESEADRAERRLLAFEASRHEGADFAKLVTWDRVSGPDPYAIKTIPRRSEIVGILRGESAIVVLDAALHEVARLEAPRQTSGLAVSDEGAVYAAGEFSPTIARFDWQGDRLVPTATYELEGVLAIRDVATGPHGTVYAVEEHEGRLISFREPPGKGRAARVRIDKSRQSEMVIGHGPVRMDRVGDRVIVNCLLDHALVIQRIDAAGAFVPAPPIRIVHDGPMWSFAARSDASGILLAVGGVEDHPLDRTIGAFGYVDSFLFLYSVDLARDEAAAFARPVNLSAIGVVTPKALSFRRAPGIMVMVSGYGSGSFAELAFEAGRAPEIT
ncbi:MAG TPA: hypothetical protein VJT73_11860, partial [Polyangiaceae bacterium]|nr:hypothetical protein [Polyangiaceae bacterium]